MRCLRRIGKSKHQEFRGVMVKFKGLGLGLFLVFCGGPVFSNNAKPWKFVEFVTPPPRSATNSSGGIKFIDARPRDSWLRAHIPGAVTIKWDQLSQPGAASRGAPRINAQIVADDLAHLNIHRNDVVYVYGDGVQGRGDEGRMAWILYGLGFEKIYVTDFLQAKAWWNGPLATGARGASPGKKWKPKPRSDLSLPIGKFRKDFGNKKYLLIAIRPAGADVTFPGLFQNIELKFSLNEFANEGLLVRKALDEWIKAKGLSPDVVILPISFAGLSSAYAVLKLKAWGYGTQLIPEGYSEELQ